MNSPTEKFAGSPNEMPRLSPAEMVLQIPGNVRQYVEAIVEPDEPKAPRMTMSDQMPPYNALQK